jgi:hypothetical protein
MEIHGEINGDPWRSMEIHGEINGEEITRV